MADHCPVTVELTSVLFLFLPLILVLAPPYFTLFCSLQIFGYKLSFTVAKPSFLIKLLIWHSFRRVVKIQVNSPLQLSVLLLLYSAFDIVYYVASQSWRDRV